MATVPPQLMRIMWVACDVKEKKGKKKEGYQKHCTINITIKSQLNYPYLA